MGMFYLLIFVLILLIGLLVFRKNIYILFKKVPSLLFVVVLMTEAMKPNVDMVKTNDVYLCNI